MKVTQILLSSILIAASLGSAIAPASAQWAEQFHQRRNSESACLGDIPRSELARTGRPCHPALMDNYESWRQERNRNEEERSRRQQERREQERRQQERREQEQRYPR